MADIQLYAGENCLIPVNSGLGFFGDGGFGDPVAIGTFQGHTFVTNSSGTIQGWECNNNKRDGPSGVIHGQEGSGILLTQLPNELATINIRFTTAMPVYTQRERIYVFDGSYTEDTPNHEIPPTGLNFYMAEIRHRSQLQTVIDIKSDSAWYEFNSLTPIGDNWLSLTESPGEQGIYGYGVEDDRHDWYVALSCSPTLLGNKMFGIVIELEYI